MSIKVNILAKIDGDQIIRALRLPELKDADVGVSFEISYDGATFTANTEEGAIDLLQCLAHPEKLNPARPSVETSERCDRPPPHNPGIPPTPRCRLLKGHEGPCDYPF